MEPSAERMPIACVHCAKAKAKCDKKVPCSRCVTKQVLCQSRPTRRSSNMAARRANAHKPRSENGHSSALLYLPEFSHLGVNHLLPGTELDLDVLSLMDRGGSFGMPQSVNYGSHQRSHSNIEYTVPFGGAMRAPEPEAHLFHNGFSASPPLRSPSITSAEQGCHKFGQLMAGPNIWDQTTYDHLFATAGDPDFSTDFEMPNFLELMDPHHISQPGAQRVFHTYGSAEPATASSSSGRSAASIDSRMDFESCDNSEPPSVSASESDALQASQESWPFFCCNQVPNPGRSPPKTAASYVEGLIQVLTTHEWQNLPPFHARGTGDVHKELSVEGDSIRPLSDVSGRILDSVTRAILQKACMTHSAKDGKMDDGRDLSEDEQKKISLPPSEIMNYFISSYVNHHRPYYACVTKPDHHSWPVLESNGQASSLLILMAIAQGAAFVSLPAARYLASGLIEACRLFLFESIERDILLSREPTILHAAFLFTTAAAWSGDNWHMDIAMGQRGMYISMMTHARMFKGHEQQAGSEDSHQDPERAWQEWKNQEQRRRIAYSWVVVDQELSLFSDTTPLLNVVNLQAPMPSLDSLWNAQSASEWSSARNEVSNGELVDGVSLRDLFTRFVEGGLSSADTNLAPLQLRLLLHPLQTLVCQLRQFLSCLPDSGRQTMGTSISKVAIKARLEEISLLLRQWYAFAERHLQREDETQWTTAANMIMYHLICLNTRTSFGSIEQFARGEVECASARHAFQWLQTHCLDGAEQVLFHCGQILRLIRSVPEHLRPPWWSGAVYRASLIAWATSLASAGGRLPLDNITEMDTPFAIDGLVPEHPSIEQYLRYKEGVPMLSRRDGTLVGMQAPDDILQHCISFLEEDLSMRATEGIVGKLQSLRDRWRNPPFDVRV